jgi:chloramphenicol 3-O-phosphotransferase
LVEQRTENPCVDGSIPPPATIRRRAKRYGVMSRRSSLPASGVGQIQFHFPSIMIIIINGTSSSGKSTTSEALKQKLGDNWLLFSTDEYLSMLGEKFVGLHPGNPEVCLQNNICYATEVSMS